MEEIPSLPSTTLTDDRLFLERFEAFMERSITDMRVFAEREHRQFQEINQRASQWHCTRLFALSSQVSVASRRARIKAVLEAVSTTLDNLYVVTGAHSFFLAVDAEDAENEGFLGGTLLGRDFWRTLRGCGTGGARLFKAQAIKGTHVGNAPVVPSAVTPSSASPSTSVQPAKKGPAGALKADIYSAMRHALRTTSGVRNAEMKWTNHANLSTYGVRLEGWPPHVPCQNPSSLNVAQNRLLLETLESGAMKFVRLRGTRERVESSPEAQSVPEQDTESMFSWLVEPSPGVSTLSSTPPPPVARGGDGIPRKRQRTGSTDSGQA